MDETPLVVTQFQTLIEVTRESWRDLREEVRALRKDVTSQVDGIRADFGDSQARMSDRITNVERFMHETKGALTLIRIMIGASVVGTIGVIASVIRLYQ
jgi:hypothetical protein